MMQAGIILRVVIKLLFELLQSKVSSVLFYVAMISKSLDIKHATKHNDFLSVMSILLESL